MGTALRCFTSIDISTKEGFMQKFAALVVAFACSCVVSAQEPAPVRPKAGKVELFKEADLKPGMKGYAWTVLSGTEPEPIPVEIVGIFKNQWGPKQDIILAQDGRQSDTDQCSGRIERKPGLYRRQAGGRGGAALQRVLTGRNLRHHTHRADARGQRFRRIAARPTRDVPGTSRRAKRCRFRPECFRKLSRPARSGAFPSNASMIPIDTPLTFAGFHENVLREFTPVLPADGHDGGGAAAASSTLTDSKPVPGWQTFAATGRCRQRRSGHGRHERQRNVHGHL